VFGIMISSTLSTYNVSKLFDNLLGTEPIYIFKELFKCIIRHKSKEHLGQGIETF